MKKIYTSIILSFLLLIAAGATAQVKSYIGLYGGLSVPRGDFASYNYDNNSAGFAKRGVTISIDGAYYFYKNLGIGASLAFQDQGELKYNDTYILAQGYTNSFNADYTTVTAVNRYHSLSFLAGPQYSFQYHKFILDLRASAGFIKVTSTPSLSIVMSGVPEQTDIIDQKSASGTVFGYSGNVGLRYKFSDNWTVGIKSTYISTDGPNVTTENRQLNVGRLVTRQPMTALQTTIGMTLNIK
ncbi:MAG TPA: outer membrane beta-barrel protein [Mucilaginibacter sp.]|nr:outer membrane beta-barrel protein [Mucilaginibacter sp.]